ncbi:MAG TPA: 3'-5' exonuclease [Gemmatimonadaceae bacterium]|nr:3'-5' exonuclease [Gemmatimonadaceae bacterium]
MRNVMVDLETLGQSAGCIVLSIGAVCFDESGIVGTDFYSVIGAASSDKHGLFADESTVAWWNKQGPEARKVLEEARDSTAELPDVLRLFAEWLPRDPFIWGNGAGFDNPILARLYSVAGLPLPWKFWNERCYRTLASLYPMVPPERKRVGTFHNALDDAKTQAIHASKILRYRDELFAAKLAASAGATAP